MSFLGNNVRSAMLIAEAYTAGIYFRQLISSIIALD